MQDGAPTIPPRHIAIPTTPPCQMRRKYCICQNMNGSYKVSSLSQ